MCAGELLPIGWTPDELASALFDDAPADAPSSAGVPLLNFSTGAAWGERDNDADWATQRLCGSRADEGDHSAVVEEAGEPVDGDDGDDDDEGADDDVMVGESERGGVVAVAAAASSVAIAALPRPPPSAFSALMSRPVAAGRGGRGGAPVPPRGRGGGRGGRRWGRGGGFASSALAATASSVPPRCPFYKRVPGTPLVVDGFQYAHATVSRHYLLTHFHS